MTTTVLSKSSRRLAATAATAGATTLGWMLWNQRGEEQATGTTEHAVNATRLSSPSSQMQHSSWKQPITPEAFPSSPSTTTQTSSLLALSPHSDDDDDNQSSTTPKPASWMQRNVIYYIVDRLPTPRLLNERDPALKLSKRAEQQRQRDETKLRRLMETAQLLQREKAPPPEQLQKLGQQLFETAYGRNVTPQMREDFLIRYGCTGFTDEILQFLIEFCSNKGIVEIGAGHGQWARALNDKYTEYVGENENDNNSDTNDNNSKQTPKQQRKKKHFDFCLAYDDQSNLPLNQHIYNQYTQPHHDYFGDVQRLGGDGSNDVGNGNGNGNASQQSQTNMLHLRKLLSSWTCRGRVLMIVYPPPGPMAVDILRTYLDAAPDNSNDTFVYVGEGRGGANGDDALFDLLENGEWVLLKELNVKKPPGDKGYEKLFVFQRRAQ